jgi:hypothetical protein
MEGLARQTSVRRVSFRCEWQDNFYRKYGQPY